MCSSSYNAPDLSRVRLLRSHPFLLLGVSSFLFLLLLLMLDLAPESPLFRALAACWQVLGIGPRAVANLLARVAPDIPGWLDVTLVIVGGLAPYAAADALLGQFRTRRSRARAQP
jgi:hypothetical protein